MGGGPTVGCWWGDGGRVVNVWCMDEGRNPRGMFNNNVQRVKNGFGIYIGYDAKKRLWSFF